MESCGGKMGKISKTYKIDYVRIMRMMMGCEKLSFHVWDYITASTDFAVRVKIVCVHLR